MNLRGKIWIWISSSHFLWWFLDLRFWFRPICNRNIWTWHSLRLNLVHAFWQDSHCIWPQLTWLQVGVIINTNCTEWGRWHERMKRMEGGKGESDLKGNNKRGREKRRGNLLFCAPLFSLHFSYLSPSQFLSSLPFLLSFYPFSSEAVDSLLSKRLSTLLPVVCI